MGELIKGATVCAPMNTKSDIAKKNMETIVEYFSLYLKDKQKFYTLWYDDEPAVLTPFTAADVAVCRVAVQAGWDAVKAFWDPIFDEMFGKFDWYIDEFIVGEDPNTIITRSHSDIDVTTGAAWGNKHLKYSATYLQVFKFVGGKVKSFEEYYDTAFLNSQYGA